MEVILSLKYSNFFFKLVISQSREAFCTDILRRHLNAERYALSKNQYKNHEFKRSIKSHNAFKDDKFVSGNNDYE